MVSSRYEISEAGFNNCDGAVKLQPDLRAHKSIVKNTAVKNPTEAIKSLSWILSRAMSAANTF